MQPPTQGPVLLAEALLTVILYSLVTFKQLCAGDGGVHYSESHAECSNHACTVGSQHQREHVGSRGSQVSWTSKANTQDHM